MAGTRAPPPRWPLLLGVLVAAPRACPAFKVLWNSPWPSCCGVKAEQVMLPLADPRPEFEKFNISVNSGPDGFSQCPPKGSTGPAGPDTRGGPCFNGHEVVTIVRPSTPPRPPHLTTASLPPDAARCWHSTRSRWGCTRSTSRTPPPTSGTPSTAAFHSWSI